MDDRPMGSALADLFKAIGRVLDLGFGCHHHDRPWRGPITRVSVDPTAFHVDLLPQKDPPAMDIVNVIIPALAYRGVQPGIKFFFGDREVFPPASRAVVTADNPTMISGVYLDDAAGGGPRIEVYPADGAPEGTVGRVGLSVDETGPNDDVVLNVTIGPFAVTSSTIGAAFRVDDFAPVVEPPPVDPPTDPAPPTDPEPPIAA